MPQDKRGMVKTETKKTENIFEKEKIMKEATMKKIINTMDNLEARWQDEKEYEDFTEYKDVIKKCVETAGCVFKSLTKKFLLTFENTENVFKVKVNSKGVNVTKYIL